MVSLAGNAQALPEAARPMAEMLMEPWENLLHYHPLMAAALLMPVGIAFLLYGFRLYRWLVVIAYVGIGVVLGMAAAAFFNFNQSVGIIAGAILLGVLAWPLHRAGWGVLGGILFAVVFREVAAVMGIEGWLPLALISVVAFLAGVALTVLLLKPLIVLITSLVGGTFLALGALSLAALWPALGGPVEKAIDARPYVPVVVVLVLAVVGSMLQVVDTARGRSKKRKAEGNG